MSYNPPFELTEKMFNLISEIMENLGILNSVNNLEKLPRLRKVSRVKSIHSSLAIENNTLSFEDVTDIIAGKRVIGPENDIIAIKNANNAYELISSLDPYNINDLLKTHYVMMDGLVSEAGKFRTKAVGVFDENGNPVHIAPPANMVHENMINLFDWLKKSKVHPLIKSCVFHYEFEFIHPFNDGNGRMGRLWQTLILTNWKPIFEWIPIESIIKDRQEDYYKAINLSTTMVSSTPFIEFMLECINSAIKDISKNTRLHYNSISNQISLLLSVIESYPMTAKELMDKLNLKSREGFRKNYLKPALEANLIKMTEPDKPKSKNQRYFKP